MKSFAKIGLALALALTMAASTAHAQTDSAAPGASSTSTNKPVKPKAHGKRYAGTIESVDADGKTITVVSTSGTTKTYEVTSKTRIKKNGQPATLGDIVKGDKVSGTSHEDPEDSTKLIASTVTIGPIRKSAPPASTPPASAAPADSSK